MLKRVVWNKANILTKIVAVSTCLFLILATLTSCSDAYELPINELGWGLSVNDFKDYIDVKHKDYLFVNESKSDSDVATDSYVVLFYENVVLFEQMFRAVYYFEADCMVYNSYTITFKIYCSQEFIETYKQN